MVGLEKQMRCEVAGVAAFWGGIDETEVAKLIRWSGVEWNRVEWR